MAESLLRRCVSSERGVVAVNKLRRNALASCGVAALVLIVFVAAPEISDHYAFLRGDTWFFLSTGVILILVLYLFFSSVVEIWRVLNKDR